MRKLTNVNRTVWILAIGAAMATAIAGVDQGQKDSKANRPTQQEKSAPKNPPTNTSRVGETQRSNTAFISPNPFGPANSPKKPTERGSTNATNRTSSEWGSSAGHASNIGDRTNTHGNIQRGGGGGGGLGRNGGGNNGNSGSNSGSGGSGRSGGNNSGNDSNSGGNNNSGGGDNSGNNSQNGNWQQDKDKDHHQTGRSGQSSYQGSNSQPVEHDNHPHHFAPPTKLHAPDNSGRRDFHHIYGEGARTGYYSYNRNWRDREFTYAFYIFNPYIDFGYISPWYFYPSLPGYISPDRCVVISNGQIPTPFVGQEYTGYQNDNSYQQGYRAGMEAQRVLNGSLDDIVNVFLHNDQKALDHLVPEAGNVNIYVDGQYSYSLGANDFYDLVRDNVNNTHTVDYQILDVRTSGNQAKVLAAHTFDDPWGDRQVVHHTYLLQLGQRSSQILEYGTSASRPW